MSVCNDETCKRKHRPDGSHYSSDPATRMKELQEEKRVGGAEHGSKGGRPRKPRASAIVAERLQEHGEEAAQVFIDGMRSPNDRIRMEAARSALEVERHESKLQMEEEKHDKEMSKDELVSGIQSLLTNDPLLKLFIKDLMGEDKKKYDYEAELVTKELPNE